MQDPLRIGILGCARIAKAALIEPARATTGLAVVAVASRELERSRHFAVEHGLERAYGGYADMLADPTIESIYNALPNSLHAHWTIEALKAGKAVLCEKPFASNAAEARTMEHTSAATGRPLMEAFHYRYHPLGRRIAELVGSGTLGALQAVDVGFEVPAALVPRDDIRFRLDLAGGAMMDVGAYGMNLLRLVSAGEPEVLSAEAQVVAPGVDGAMRVRLSLPGQASGTLSASLCAEAFRAWLTVTGERGQLTVVNPFIPQMGHRLELKFKSAGEPQVEVFDATPTYVFQARAFEAYVRTGQGCLSTAADAVANMAAIDAVYEAAGLGARGAP
ncbi:MAG: Gfo/Idh/MocA family oxidoreductase [Proteobacteria bacterium]|nr:Gfo/Idh/MocA family oxidoreductase [Pseudomonadota bacterium]